MRNVLLTLILNVILAFSAYAGQEWTRFDVNVNEKIISALPCDDNGEVIIASEKTLYYFDEAIKLKRVESINIADAKVSSIIRHGGYLTLTTDRGVFRSGDNGLTWEEMFKGAFEGYRGFTSMRVLNKDIYLTDPFTLY